MIPRASWKPEETPRSDIGQRNIRQAAARHTRFAALRPKVAMRGGMYESLINGQQSETRGCANHRR